MGLLIRLHPRWKQPLVAAGLDGWDALDRWPAEGPAVARSRTSRTDRVAGAGASFHRKRYSYPTRRDRWRAALRGTWFGRPRALREYEALVALGERGVRVVEPVAYAERRRLGWVHETLLFTRTEPGEPVDPADPEVVEALGRALGEAHEKGVDLGCPALRDVVASTGSPGAARVTFLDLPRASTRRRPLASPRRERDVSRIAAGLAATAGALETLLEGYGSTLPLDREQLEKATEASRTREARRRRGGTSGVRD